MLNFSDSKSMAKALRKGLAERKIDISHSDSLELVARQFGFANWNMLSARIEGDAIAPRLPDGWFVGGRGRPSLYRVGLDPAERGAVRIASTLPAGEVDAEAFSTLMQTIAADDYRRGAIRITAELKSRATGRGSLWLRIDGPFGGASLRFDNMMSRKVDGPVTGETQWTARSMVFDVPDAATTINYGVMLLGAGELWARNFAVEAVGLEEAERNRPQYRTHPTGFGAAA